MGEDWGFLRGRRRLLLESTHGGPRGGRGTAKRRLQQEDYDAARLPWPFRSGLCAKWDGAWVSRAVRGWEPLSRCSRRRWWNRTEARGAARNGTERNGRKRSERRRKQRPPRGMAPARGPIPLRGIWETRGRYWCRRSVPMSWRIRRRLLFVDRAGRESFWVPRVGFPRGPVQSMSWSHSVLRDPRDVTSFGAPPRLDRKALLPRIASRDLGRWGSFRAPEAGSQNDRTRAAGVRFRSDGSWRRKVISGAPGRIPK